LPCPLTHRLRPFGDSVPYLAQRRRASQPGLLHLLRASKLETPSRTSGSGLRSGRKDLLCPRLTSADPSRYLSIPVAPGRSADLPGYCAPTFTLMPATSTPRPSVQVPGFEDICLLTRPGRLICGFCSSGQRFACGFLQIPPRDGHPCRPANSSPCRACRGLAPPSECALPGAQTRRPGRVKYPLWPRLHQSATAG
jgi:hypothetical protein